MRPDARTIEAVAPLRISFVGGGTDFPHWYLDHGGAVLSATIDHVVRVRLTPRTDRRVSVRSLDLERIVRYDLDDGPPYDGVMDLATAAIDRIGSPGGIDVEIRSEAPPGSGLGGSSALVTAVVAGLAMLLGRRMTAREVARVSYAIERDDLGISGGWQDQYAAAFGGMNLLEFSSTDVRVSPLRMPRRAVADLERNLVLCYSGVVRRNVGLIDRQIELHREGREDTHLGMKHLQETAFALRDTLEDGRIDRIGPLLRHAFEAKKQMNPHIAEHTPIEAMLEGARRAGASGGKICGAGGGGYLLIARPPAAARRVATELERLGGQLAPFRFRPSGVRAFRGAEVWAPRG
ncbi:MAG TPA: GHMP kinase [Actinomycetota bacterium]|jgi:D-glycero-alpha-D-manno-heptose-7-phosphate kinase